MFDFCSVDPTYSLLHPCSLSLLQIGLVKRLLLARAAQSVWIYWREGSALVGISNVVNHLIDMVCRVYSLVLVRGVSSIDFISLQLLLSFLTFITFESLESSVNIGRGFLSICLLLVAILLSRRANLRWLILRRHLVVNIFS